MVSYKQKQLISVPCKNKLTESTETFIIMAYGFSEAKKELECILDLSWIIGFNAM